MAKNKTLFSCSSCGASSPKWLGKCPVCGEFNTYSEETLIEKKKSAEYRGFDSGKLTSLEDINITDSERLKTGMEELDRVFGGGIVRGSMVLLGRTGRGKIDACVKDGGYGFGRGKGIVYIRGRIP